MSLAHLMHLVAPPLCFGCGGHAGAGSALCAGCRRALRWLGASRAAGEPPLWAPLAYEGPAAALARALKFRGARGVADVMAGQMVANVPPRVLDGGREASPALVPVPLHPRRRRRRGFNQAELLARALAGRTGLLLDDCLERRGAAGTQVGRGRAERRSALGHSVRAARRAPQTAVLVDDVATTGATLAACADALRSAGSVEVRAVVYARTPGR